MLNKISNLKLVLGLVLLGLVYLAVVYFDSSKSEELEKQLVAIDTAMVTEIIIASADETVNLYKQNQQWQVELPGGKRVNALPSKINTLLDQLMDIRADRLAAKDQSKWPDYHVDSTGTHLQIREGESTSLDMIVGSSGSTSYLRLTGENEVYASDGFRGLNNSDRINNFRNNLFIEMDTDSITSISFNYPGDSAFQVINDAGRWSFDDGSLADSVKVENYLDQLGLKYNDNFAGQDGGSLGPQMAEIVISSQNNPQIFIKAYNDPADSVIYQSSINPEAFFDDETLGGDYFVGQSALRSTSE